MSNEVSCDGVARRVNGENPLDVLVGVSTPYGPLLTDDYGRPIRLPSTETDHAASGIIPSRS